MNDKFSVSAMFRCRRFSDAEIKHYCEVLAESGARHLVLDAETLQEVLDHPERLGHYRRLIGGFGLDFRDAHSIWGDNCAKDANATQRRTKVVRKRFISSC